MYRTGALKIRATHYCADVANKKKSTTTLVPPNNRHTVHEERIVTHKKNVELLNAHVQSHMKKMRETCDFLLEHKEDVSDTNSIRCVENILHMKRLARLQALWIQNDYTP